MSSRVRTVLIFAITCALLAFFFRGANLAEVWAETRRADLRLLALAVAFTMVTYALRAWRWQSLLSPIGQARFSVAFRATVIGFAATFLLPARAGEVIRPYLLARKERFGATATFATIILERLLDLAVVLLLFAAFVFTMPAEALSGEAAQLAHVKFWGGIAAGAAVVGLLILFALAGHPERLGRAAGRAERVLPARAARIIAHFVQAFAEGLAVMRRPGRLLAALLQSFPLWLSIAAGIWLTSRAFSITLPFTASFLVMTLLVVGVAVPTPGAIGGFHLAYTFAVQTFFAVPDERAQGAALVLHAISFVPVTILGIYYMTREGLTLRGAQALARGEDRSGVAPDAPGVPSR
jgi:uncharacterized protein (TIRG00374 family)